MVKRKRSIVTPPPHFLHRVRYKTPHKRMKFTLGVDRVGGYYGRYAGGANARSGERKFHDVTLDDNVVSAGGTTTNSLNLIAQGVTESERIGRKCTLKSISWSYDFKLPEIDAQATPAAGDTVRLMVYLDKQCNGATATVTDILESADFHSFKNLANSSRFVTLLDRRVELNYEGLASDGAGVVSQAQNIQYGSWHKACNIPIEFDSVTGAITEIRSNNVGVLLMSINGVAVFKSKFRLRFSDGTR